MKIICISGKAQHGKDTTASILKRKFEDRGDKVLVAHYADLLKYICRTFFEWNGEKDEAGRRLLQYVGTDVIRQNNPDYWVNFILSILCQFEGAWDWVIIPDTRFPNEVDGMKHLFDAIHLRIVRTNFQSPLTKEQQTHLSEVALDEYEADYTILNDGSIDDLEKKIDTWIRSISYENS